MSIQPFPRTVDIPVKQTAVITHDGEGVVLSGVGEAGPFRAHLSRDAIERLMAQMMHIWLDNRRAV